MCLGHFELGSLSIFFQKSDLQIGKLYSYSTLSEGVHARFATRRDIAYYGLLAATAHVAAMSGKGELRVAL